VCLGGYVREASRPRFLSPSGVRQAGFNRIAHYDKVYVPQERACNVSMRMVRGSPPYKAELPVRPERPTVKPETAADMVSYRCISCHTLERVHRYKGSDWRRVVGRMRAYGMRLTDEESQKVIAYLRDDTREREPSSSQETPAGAR